MHSTEVVPNYEQRNSSFQHGEFLADSVRLSGKAPDMHSYAQIRSLNVRSRNARPIRPSGFDFGNCCNDCAAAVPFWACLGTPVNLLKLRKVNITAVPLFDCSHVAPESVTRNLVNALRPFAQIADKLVCAHRVSRPDVVRQNHFGIRIQRKPCPRIAPIGGRFNRDSLSVTADHTPQLVKLDKFRTDVANHPVKDLLRSLCCCHHEGQNRVPVDASDAGDGANAHSFQHHSKGFLCLILAGVVASDSRLLICEYGRAGITAVTLKVVAAAKLFDFAVIAFAACHGLFPLEFCGEKADNEFGSELWLTPRFGLALPTVRAGSRALLCGIKSRWWFYRDFDSLSGNANCDFASAHCLRLLSGSPVSAGLSYLLPKSFLFLSQKCSYIGRKLIGVKFPIKKAGQSARTKLIHLESLRMDSLSCFVSIRVPFQNHVDGSKGVGIRIHVMPKLVEPIFYVRRA